MFYIYGLHLEGDEEIRYVGSTTQLAVRKWQHFHREESERVAERIEWVKANKDRLQMTILEIVDSNGTVAEQRWIADLRMKGHRLFNQRRATGKHVIGPARMARYLDQMPDDLE